MKKRVIIAALGVWLSTVQTLASDKEPFRFLAECRIAGGLGLTGNQYYPEFALYQNTASPKEGFFVGRSLLIMGRNDIGDTNKATETWSRKMFALTLAPVKEATLISDIGAEPTKWSKGGFKISFRDGAKFFSDDYRELTIPKEANRFQLLWGAQQYFCSTVQ